MRVAVAMSGGVDSLRTAALLLSEGHEVVGLHMRLLPEDGNGAWSAFQAIGEKEARVRELARQLGVEVHVVDLREPFNRLVIQPFLRDYREGRTPNPCVICNPKVKFGLLLRESKRLGAEKLATGHYVQLATPMDRTGRWGLHRGMDSAKDQSYFLYGLTQDQLAHVLFPLGSHTKASTFDWAKRNGFAPLLEEESQEICFIPSGHYRDFLNAQLGMEDGKRGPIVDTDGRELGEHKGIFNYTIGQRRGLGVPSTAPYYVVGIVPETNTVRVGRAEDLYCSELKAKKVNWVSVAKPERSITAQVRIRNQHRPAPATITPDSSDGLNVRFITPQRAVTPGQAVVFYQGDAVLGGGTIVL